MVQIWNEVIPGPNLNRRSPGKYPRGFCSLQTDVSDPTIVSSADAAQNVVFGDLPCAQLIPESRLTPSTHSLATQKNGTPTDRRSCPSQCVYENSVQTTHGWKIGEECRCNIWSLNESPRALEQHWSTVLQVYSNLLGQSIRVEVDQGSKTQSEL